MSNNIAKDALVRIAADNEVTSTGHRKKISRVSIINIAREACLHVGWDFGGQSGKHPPVSEFDHAGELAHKVLDRVNADPDDDLAVLARQFLRGRDLLATFQQDNRRLRKLLEPARGNLTPV